MEGLQRHELSFQLRVLAKQCLGGAAIPVGAYIRKGDDLRFEPNLVSLLAVGIPFVWVAGRALSRVIRALTR